MRIGISLATGLPTVMVLIRACRAKRGSSEAEGHSTCVKDAVPTPVMKSHCEINGRAVMNDSTHKVTPQMHTVFSDLYVREHHNDAADNHLPPSDVDQVIKSLKVSMFKEVMKSLRSALGIRGQR